MARQTDSKADLARLYREAIKRHAANPVGYRLDIAATHRHEEYNPLCGDRIEVALQVTEGHVTAAAFDGEACAICLASASLLCSLAPGLRVAEMTAMGRELHKALKGGGDLGLGESRMNPLPQNPLPQNPLPQNPLPQSPLPQNPLPRELQPLLGVRPYPSRVRCATLPWEAAAGAAGDSDPT
jgi:nitrogen fixation NifU-like protein